MERTRPSDGLLNAEAAAAEMAAEERAQARRDPLELYNPSAALPEADNEDEESLWQRVQRGARHFWYSFAQWRYYGSHAKREMCKRKFNYCLGVTACFVVVLVAAVCYTLIAKAPIVFLQQGESESGQIDLLLRPSRSPFLNYSQVVLNTAFSRDLSYHAPRLELNADVYDAGCTGDINSLGLDVADRSWRYDGPLGYPLCAQSADCLPELCAASAARYPKPAQLAVIDSAREQAMGLGRAWPLQRIPAGEVVLTEFVAQPRGLRAGDTVWVSVHVNNFFVPLFANMLLRGLAGYNVTLNSTNEAIAQANKFRRVVAPLRVHSVVEDALGKYGTASRPYVFMEHDSFQALLLSEMNPRLASVTLNSTRPNAPRNVSAALSAAPLVEFATSVPMNLPPNRVDVYIETNYDVVQQRVINFASRAMYFVGFPDLDSEMDILNTLFTVRFFTLYLGLILSVILTILFILSAILIYSLLMISIETRTFELGVYRMVGMSRLQIVEMLLMQAVSYSLPAWALGLALAQLVAAAVLGVMEESVGVPVSKALTADAIGLATFLGICIPFVAAVVPIRNALGRNLHDALDTQHSKTLAVQISIERSEDDQLSSAWVVIGVGIAVFGFLIYYLLPLSLLSFNLTLFFNIFFGLLLGMLFGLILLSLNAEHLMERVVVGTTLWWESRPVRSIALKNLVAHRPRNRKTTIMYALALGFIIFITVAYRMELTTAKFRTLKQSGSHLVVEGEFDYRLYTQLEQVAANHSGAAADWAWVTTYFGERRENEKASLTNLGHIQSAEAHIYAVSPNFFEVADDDFLIASMRDMDTGLSFGEQLYTVRGSQSALLPSSMRSSHNLKSLDASSSFLFAVEYARSETRPASLDIRRYKPLAFLDSTPLFSMSRFPNDFAPQDVVVSLPTLMHISNGSIGGVEDLFFDTVLFRLHPDASEAEVDALVNDLNRVAEQVGGVEVRDFRDFQDTLDRTNSVMDLIFSFATYIAMGLCLFSLMASMLTNILEQSKEIAVLRAMGLRRWQIVRIYIYEAYVLVMAAALLGLLIGCIMAWTMMAQRVLFTQLPVGVEFPYTLLLLVMIGAIVCAFIAAFGPARDLTRKPIAQIFRSGF